MATIRNFCPLFQQTTGPTSRSFIDSCWFAPVTEPVGEGIIHMKRQKLVLGINAAALTIPPAACENAGSDPASPDTIPFERGDDQVMDVFCTSHECENILFALQSVDKAAVSAQDLLKMRDEGLSWEQIRLRINQAPTAD
jgi:hypothetical protein